MIKLVIPGKGELGLEHLIFDVNGTLAVDGQLLPSVPEYLQKLDQNLTIHLLTADTHGKQAEIDQQLGCKAVRVNSGDEAGQKAAYVHELGPEGTAAVGQGSNDSEMLKAAQIGVCLISQEGTALETLLAADIIVPDIESAIGLFLTPTRLVASLRK